MEKFKIDFKAELEKLNSVSKAFYCQSEIEGESKCKQQCEHCKEYYKPLANTEL